MDSVSTFNSTSDLESTSTTLTSCIACSAYNILAPATCPACLTVSRNCISDSVVRGSKTSFSIPPSKITAACHNHAHTIVSSNYDHAHDHHPPWPAESFPLSSSRVPLLPLFSFPQQVLLRNTLLHPSSHYLNAVQLASLQSLRRRLGSIRQHTTFSSSAVSRAWLIYLFRRLDALFFRSQVRRHVELVVPHGPHSELYGQTSQTYHTFAAASSENLPSPSSPACSTTITSRSEAKRMTITLWLYQPDPSIASRRPKQRRTALALASTLLHEMCHAYLSLLSCRCSLCRSDVRNEHGTPHGNNFTQLIVLSMQNLRRWIPTLRDSWEDQYKRQARQFSAERRVWVHARKDERERKNRGRAQNKKSTTNFLSNTMTEVKENESFPAKKKKIQTPKMRGKESKINTAQAGVKYKDTKKKYTKEKKMKSTSNCHLTDVSSYDSDKIDDKTRYTKSLGNKSQKKRSAKKNKKQSSASRERSRDFDAPKGWKRNMKMTTMLIITRPSNTTNDIGAHGTAMTLQKVWKAQIKQKLRADALAVFCTADVERQRRILYGALFLPRSEEEKKGEEENKMEIAALDEEERRQTFVRIEKLAAVCRGMRC